ncbi:MAG: hypothetical protein M3426_09165 [Actinomycetota bacterium]|nr:hypothetical protein [Actinomycetota bacterium]
MGGATGREAFHQEAAAKRATKRPLKSRPTPREETGEAPQRAGRAADREEEDRAASARTASQDL